MSRRIDPARVAEKRARIATVAAGLFAARGYDRTSVAQIAESAGTSAASIFYYFPDKASIFRAVFEQDLPKAQALIARCAEAPDPVVAILEVLDALTEDAADPSAAGLLTELLRRGGDDSELVAVVRSADNVVRDGLTLLISRGIDEGEIDSALDAEATAQWLRVIVDSVYLNARPGYLPRTELHRTVLGYLAPRSSLEAGQS